MPAPTEFLSSARARPWVVLTLVFLISLPAVTTRIYASDEIEYFAYLRSLYFDRDLSFDNEYRYFYDHGIAQGGQLQPDGTRLGNQFHKTFLESTTATGLRTNFAPIGTAMLWAPFYVVADAGVRIARAFGSSVPADGFSKPYIAAVAYGSALFGFLALLLSSIAVTRILGGGPGAALAVWVGTPLVFYMYVAPAFSHAASAFAVAAFVVVWLSVRDDWSPWGVAALGAAAAVMGMVREQDAFIAIGPAVDFLRTLSGSARDGRPVRRMLVAGAAGVLAFAICYLPQALSYITLFGHLGPDPIIAGKMTWTAPNAWRVLASPDNGWFFWTPLALLALVGLVALTLGYGARDTGGTIVHAGERRWIGGICLLMIATQIYVSGSLNTWAGAGSFGQRRLVGLTIFLVIGLATLVQMMRAARPRFALNAILVLSIWWNLGLIAQFAIGLMDRSRVEPLRNAYNNFVTIPRVFPALAYRYVFDRQSFYHSRTPSSH